MPIPHAANTSDDLRKIYRFATTPGQIARAVPLIARIHARPHCWLMPEEEEYLAKVQLLHERLRILQERLARGNTQ
jgi:hypothetical protein